MLTAVPGIHGNCSVHHTKPVPVGNLLSRERVNQWRSASAQGGSLTPYMLGSTLNGRFGQMEFPSVFVQSRVIHFRHFCVACLISLVAACAAGPPVQEMSDARQAIAAATEAGAEELAGDRLGEAQDLLDVAEKYLEAGGSTNYWQAKQAAPTAVSAAKTATASHGCLRLPVYFCLLCLPVYPGIKSGGCPAARQITHPCRAV